MTRKLIGLYQLITGVLGVLLLGFSAVNKSAAFKSQEFIIQIVIGILLYGLLAWSGYGLLNKLKNAKRYSMALQAFQIPFIAISGVFYQFCAASFLSIGVKGGQFAFEYSISPVMYSINSNVAGQSVFMIYLIPIILLYGLSKIK